MFLSKMSKNLQISFVAMIHLAEGLFLNALLTLKVEIMINQLLCCVVKHLFYIPSVLVVWRRTASQTGAFATNIGLYTCKKLSRYTPWRRLGGEEV
jgi:hypothetical protein